MPEEAAFLAALRESPTDDTTRLVYADWLDERGDATRADYLRLVAGAAALGNFADTLTLLLSVGAGLDVGWRDAVAARFEVVYLGTVRDWEYHVMSVLEAEYRINRLQFAPLRQAAPAVLDDRYTLEAAVRCVEVWTDLCVVRIDPPGRRAEPPGRFPSPGDVFRAQVGDTRDVWFVVRPMDSAAPPVPNRFEVVLAGRFDSLSSQSAQVADVFVEPLQGLFGVGEDDAQHVLYASGLVPLRGGLSFAAALATTAEYNKSIKRHAMAKSLRDLVSIDIRPDVPPAAFSL